MRLVSTCIVLGTWVSLGFAQPTTPPPGYRLSNASSGIGSTSLNRIAQLAFKPGDPFHLYASRGFNNVVTRYDYDPVAGKLSNPVNVLNLASVSDGMKAITGIGFHGDDMWITRWPGFVLPRPGAISRLRDGNGDGDFNDANELTNFATGIELGHHTFSQVQIVGNSLYTGIGMQSNTGDPDEEDLYNGTVVRIGNLNNPIAMNLSLSSDRTAFLNSGVSDGRMRYYAGGFRNPYGLFVKPDGEVWVTDNGADAEPGFDETLDFLYRDVELNDLGHFPPEGEPGAPVPTIDPLAILGSHKGASGFDFIPRGPDRKKALVALAANNTNGRRLVTVHPETGVVSEFLTGFNTVTDVVVDPFGRLLVSDWDQNAIYLLDPTYDGDANLDRIVNIKDLMALANNWQSSGTWATGDFDGNGMVDAADLGLLATNWQASDASLAEALAVLGLPTVVVPEPMGAISLGALLMRRRSCRRGIRRRSA